MQRAEKTLAPVWKLNAPVPKETIMLLFQKLKDKIWRTTDKREA